MTARASAHTCNGCRRSIPAGLAVIRSIAFRQVTWCRSCWAARQGGAA